MDSIQLALPLDLQKTAVNIVMEDFETSKRMRDEKTFFKTSKGEDLRFDDWLKQLKDLYFGYREAKTTPWRFCSNRSMMIGMAILETLHSRLFPAVYNENLTRWQPAEETDVPKAESVEKLMFWWVRVRSKLRDFFDQWTRYSIAFGRTLTESSWDVQLIDKGERTPQQQSFSPDGTPQMMGGEKILDRIEKTISSIIPEEDIFLPPGATDIQRDPVIIRKHYFYRDLEEMERDGKSLNVNEPTTEEANLTLKERLIVQGVPGASNLPPEQIEEIRQLKRRNVPVDVLVWYGAIDIDGDGFPEQVRLLVSPEYRIYLGGVMIKDISARGLRHLDMTLFMPRIDEPQTLRGLGVLEQIKEMAMELDAIFNQLTDGNTLQVLKPGFYDPGGDLDAPQLTLAPNKWSPVSNPQQSIFVPEINVPTEKLLLAARFVLEFIERVTAASAYVMGKESEIVGGSGTATRTNAIVGAANERHSIPGERLKEGAARILTQHLDLLQVNLPEGLESRVLGPKNQPIFSNPVSKESINGEYDAYLLPDDSMGSKEAQRQFAQLLYTVALGNPIIASDPAKLYKSTADLYKAYGKNPETYLGPEPPMSTVLSPEEEHHLMVQGDFNQVKATILQNPIEHIMKHQQLPMDPALQAMPPILQQEVLNFNQAHIQEHMQVLQIALQAASPKKQKGVGSAVNGQGAAPGGVGGAPPVGPEPGVGSLQQPLAAAGNQSRRGESAPPA